jgi:hypothetical protein
MRLEGMAVNFFTGLAGIISIMSLPAVSHDRGDETPEAKARWFQSLTLAQRMEHLCAFTEFILAVNPRIVEKRDAQPRQGRVRMISKT